MSHNPIMFAVHVHLWLGSEKADLVVFLPARNRRISRVLSQVAKTGPKQKAAKRMIFYNNERTSAGVSHGSSS